MRTRYVFITLLLLLAESQGCTSTGSLGSAVALPTGSDANWMTYNRTLGGDRFSPLGEINRTNGSSLRQDCSEWG